MCSEHGVVNARASAFFWTSEGAGKKAYSEHKSVRACLSLIKIEFNPKLMSFRLTCFSRRVWEKRGRRIKVCVLIFSHYLHVSSHPQLWFTFTCFCPGKKVFFSSSHEKILSLAQNFLLRLESYEFLPFCLVLFIYNYLQSSSPPAWAVCSWAEQVSWMNA